MEVSQEIKNRTTVGSSNSTSGYFYKENKNRRIKWWKNGWTWSISLSLSMDTSGIHLRHRSACRTPGESGKEYLTSGKEYMETPQTR